MHRAPCEPPNSKNSTTFKVFVIIFSKKWTSTHKLRVPMIVVHSLTPVDAISPPRFARPGGRPPLAGAPIQGERDVAVVVDIPSAQLMPRRGLADDRLTGGEVVCLRPTRTGASPIWDPESPILRQMAQLAGPPGSGVIAVAYPAADLHAERMLSQVAASLAAAGLPAHRLELVLSEASLVALDGDGVLALSALRDLGVGLCADAFGTGTTSLTLLRRLPLTSLKLARNVVRALPQEREDAAIARAIIATAQAMELTVIADGVESERQRAFLAYCGCDEGQGPLFGPPLSLAGALRTGIAA